MKNYTNEQRQTLINELIPFLNSMQQNDSSKNKFIASTKPVISFNDLMALSDEELNKLEVLMKSAKSAKKTQNEAAKYDSYTKPKAYTITDAPLKTNHKIV
ncbi:hypothetical protein IRZ71_24315 [Flavobacterium sp. ANB]|uniref:hypothetical protein n=1 Tax=unclassified Flavobacterium TaxID=196869 RepID=UPI0012B93D6D|nr:MULTISPECIES: hypothetical protein [unclassified Flavobacterium]MBF4519481.1 hypothetical protein [Flavobacterium sp. ANB]MTD72508.1 hypothetical protein [Flavobacterium sp. LC2016-13]